MTGSGAVPGNDVPEAAEPASEPPERNDPIAPPRGQWTPGAWTTRRWLTTGMSAAIALLAVLAVAGAWVFGRTTDVSDHLVGVSSPALVSAVRLESALLDQETGVRGYGLTGQTSFLDPYTDGVARERDAVTRIRTLLAHDHAALADLDRTLAAAETWQSRFARPIAAAPPGRPVAVASERADEAKRDFDAVRAGTTRLQRTLQAVQAHDRAELDHVHRLRNWIFSLIVLVVLVLVVMIFEGLRRGVTAPLTRLTDDLRQVADGDFDHEVTPSGPADMRALAADVDRMRARLARELRFSDTARKSLDAQAVDLQRSNAELEQFAYIASHDLQEPLRKVASFCQLLQRRYADQLDERAGQYIAFAVDGANRMQTLINDLLAFSRVGRVHGETAEVDLEEVFGRAEDALSLAIAETGAEVTHDPLPVLHGDATQLGMLMQNMLSNAIKFRSPDRPPKVHLSAWREDDHWAFACADNGIGIEPEFAERVFVIFQRLHTRDAYPGNGIGLALCKKVVEFHGGTIGIDPAHAPGARITFTLSEPAVPAVLEAARP
ncbi:CHASE3 domain-containing protein [Actinacidiphila sp. DG2A-62]|uniref:sensor histidine kinase n=1 Tax=Actinacidiphila sp. DG2A-62 TaxID=3108821 RepID=UPI002DBA60A7|nr:CHASE3 domain-containing protein [Actinacidiphila sp. DG2A-62]MEC3998332.1 CHASE3 domain-containing protein [Actinacidiphila sp. DG2A-62]